ncbi:peptide-methionine (S)-S-oxide reductase MsrA [Dongia sp.]|uniref:peptide-methionine (S)-S-oxide reductase MsrA n=1 Tax=Dongia sp. TaxID=1977262 RepID=UPI0037516E29
MPHSKKLLPRSGAVLLLAGVIAAAAFGLKGTPSIAEDAKVIPAPVTDLDRSASPAESETAVFAGGCFWGVQGVFQHVEGVTKAVSGYAGGAAETAQYEMVGSGETGHAESVQVTYDPHQISYGQLLQIYFSVAHDPTELNYQGPDMGPQYRSTIFPTSRDQAKVAAAYIKQLNDAKVFGNDIVTTIEEGKAFYPAEDYHQDYLTLHPNQPYIVINDLPKVRDLERLYPDHWRAEPVLVMAGAN